MVACNGGFTSNQELQTIFDLISSNNFHKLRTLLDPLTLHDRRCIVNQNLYGKSTLFHAIQCGSKPIVKYLLVECLANANEETWNGRILDWPLRKVVEKLDIFMLFILKRCYGYPLRTYRTQETVDYTLKSEYYSVIWFLEIRISEILRSDRGNTLIEMLRLTNLKGRKTYNMRSEMFLEVTDSGNLSKSKLLVAGGVDINLANDKGENGLSLAILNGNEEVVDFLIKYKVYSLRSFACSLELCGAKLIIFQAKKHEGCNLWRKAMQIRNELEYGFADKKNITGFGSEFKTDKEIDMLETTENGNIYLQALVIFRRLLPRRSQVTIDAFKSIKAHFNIMEPLNCLAFLCEMFDLVPNSHKQRSALETGVNNGFFSLCSIHFPKEFNENTDYIPSFHELLKLLDPHFWKPLIPRMPDFFVFCYTHLLKTLLRYIPLIQSRRPPPNDEYLIRFHLRDIFQAEIDPFPTTILHIAIDDSLTTPGISFLLECKADTNGKDFLGNTPLHLVGTSAQPRPYLLEITDLLIKAGGHIDTVNNDGVQPKDLLVQNRLLENPLKHISLQCLAAQAIHTQSVFVDEEEVSKHLLDFIKLHSTREIQPFNFFFYYRYKYGF